MPNVHSRRQGRQDQMFERPMKQRSHHSGREQIERDDDFAVGNAEPMADFFRYHERTELQSRRAG